MPTAPAKADHAYTLRLGRADLDHENREKTRKARISFRAFRFLSCLSRSKPAPALHDGDLLLSQPVHPFTSASICSAKGQGYS